MGTITTTVDTMYNKEDVVIFEFNGKFIVGLVIGYSVDHSAGISIWYNIAVSKNLVLGVTTRSEVHEDNIIGKIEDPILIRMIKERIVSEVSIDI